MIWGHPDDSCGDPACSCELGSPWSLGGLRRDKTAIPSTDAYTIALIDDTVEFLVVVRGGGIGDAGAALSCLVSLIGEADSRLADVVADARDQGYTWDDIADRLAASASGARRRYAGYARWRRSVPPEPD